VTIHLIVIAVVMAFAAGFTGGWKMRAAGAEAEAAATARAHVVAVENARSVERVRVERMGEIADAAEKQAQDALRRAAAADDVARRLRDHVTRLAAACTGSAPDSTGAPTSGPGLVLSNLYRGADTEAHELAASFDAARRAGLACERAYDALRE
jgi:hypothetical protein